MKFIVIGAEKKSGRDVQFPVTAASAEEAQRLASEKGVLVSSVKPAPAMATDVSTGSLPIWGDEPGDAAAANVISTGPAGPSASPVSRITLQSQTGAAAMPGAASPAQASGAAPAAAGAAPGGRDSAIPASARYHVIQNPALYLLEAAVNKHMKEGWEPLGGIQVSYATNQLVFYQALVRGGPGE